MAPKKRATAPKPGAPPSAPPAASSSSSASPDPSNLLSEAEQLRIIEQSRILSQIPLGPRPSEVDASFRGAGRKPLLEFSERELQGVRLPSREGEGSDGEEAGVESEGEGGAELGPGREREQEQDTLPLWVDKIFDVVIHMLPLLSFFVSMDMLARQQYAEPVSFALTTARLSSFAPPLLFLVAATLHRPSHPLTRATFLALSAVGGSCMIQIINRDSYLRVIRLCPALGTLWVYAVVRLELVDAVLSLVAVGAWVWYKNLKISAF